MNTLIVAFFALSVTLSPDSDKDAITETLTYYMAGAMNKDFNTLKKAFHKDAIMTMADEAEGTFKQVNAREFFSKMEPGEPLTRTNKIVSIDIQGNTAIARLRIGDAEKIFHDFMTFQKLKGTWYIVNKIFFREMK